MTTKAIGPGVHSHLGRGCGGKLDLIEIIRGDEILLAPISASGLSLG
jgi:hypothetical protein